MGRGILSCFVAWGVLLSLIPFCRKVQVQESARPPRRGRGEKMNTRLGLRIRAKVCGSVLKGEHSRLRSASWALVIVVALAHCPLLGQAQTVTTTVAVGSIPAAIAANPVTNKIYVASGPITVIDGATNAITSVNSGGFPVAVAVNPVTNKIYFADKASNPGRVIVIDGTTNAITYVTDPNANEPVALALNPVTNKIYVANGL